ncbi:hypothetical protein M422DRAFT_119956, partial [Sphaerobolus stellatus SS14]
VLNLSLFEFTLLWLEIEFVFLQALEYQFGYPPVLSDGFGKDKNIVMENVVHHGLKSCWAIAESKEHHKWFKQASIRPEGCLPLVSLLNAYIIVTP